MGLTINTPSPGIYLKVLQSNKRSAIPINKDLKPALRSQKMKTMRLLQSLRNPIFARLYTAQTTSLLGDAFFLGMSSYTVALLACYY